MLLNFKIVKECSLLLSSCDFYNHLIVNNQFMKYYLHLNSVYLHAVVNNLMRFETEFEFEVLFMTKLTML